MASDRDKVNAWRARHGKHVEKLTLANRELFEATKAWPATTVEEAEALRDRTMLWSRNLIEAVDHLAATPPVRVSAVDRPLREALANLRRGADLLAGLPLELNAAAQQVREAGPSLKSGYDWFGRVVEAINNLR